MFIKRERRMRDLKRKAYTYVNFIKKRILHHLGKSLDKEFLDRKISSFQGLGIEQHPNCERVIISLTSFPARIHEVKYAIYSLLQQSYKPDRIILWLGKEEFPHREADLPDDLIKLKDNGLSINFVKDLKSFKKLIPALQADSNFLIVTVDDDIYYPKYMLKKLMQEHKKKPGCIIAYRAHRIQLNKAGIRPYSKWKFSTKNRINTPSYLNFFTGVGGVLYDRKLLYKDILNENLFMKYCPRADDVWFNAMAVLQGTKTKIVKGGAYPLRYINPEEQDKGINTLSSYNNREGGNDLQIRAVLQHYPEILSKLQNDDLFDKNT